MSRKEKIFRGIRNLSVRRTIILYLAVSLICSFLLSAVLTGLAGRIQRAIWWKYTDQESYFEAVEGERGYLAEIKRPPAWEMSPLDSGISEVCVFLETYGVLILAMTGSCCAVFLFYRHKLKGPLRSLRKPPGGLPGRIWILR